MRSLSEYLPSLTITVPPEVILSIASWIEGRSSGTTRKLSEKVLENINGGQHP